jgi:tetratricopeptide (TPR) repeat protein
MRYFFLVAILLAAAIPSPLAAQRVGEGTMPDGGPASTVAAGNLRNIANTSTLDVYLKSANGTAVKGAVVTLLKLSGEFSQQLTTKTDTVHFRDIAATQYNVQVSAPGYEPATMKVEALTRNTYKLVFELQPRSAQELALANRMATLPGKAQKPLSKAMDALRADNPAGARAPLDALQRLAPDHPEVNYLLGVYASKTNDDQHAKTYWNRAIALDPNHLPALLSLSDLALREKDLDQALALSLRTVNTDPTSWRAHAVLANAYSQKNDYPNALQHAQRALELGYAQATVVLPLEADLLARTGKPTRAIEILQSYLSEHPTDAGAKQRLARIEAGEFIPAAVADTPEDSSVADAATALGPVSKWLPPDVDENMPPVESAGSCDLAVITREAGKRIEELVHNVDRYTATESLLHESINKWGVPASATSRKFEYVASITELQPGVFNMEEYRRVRGLPAEFPDGIATLGLPGLAMIFHPHYAAGYNMVCEGLSHWDGVAVWQVHFRQKPDQPNNIRAYRQSIQSPPYPVALKGRAWIAADSHQLVRLETDLVAPAPEIKLVADHIIIEYGPVNFRGTQTELWLPHSAEVFWHLNNLRMHRRHTFSDYLLFSVDDKQKISAPKTDVRQSDDSSPIPPPAPASPVMAPPIGPS